MSTLTAERARQLFHYDPQTGEFTNKITRSPRAIAGKKAGSIGTKGHLVVSIDTKQYYVARVIWLWMTGEWPKGQVDHEDLNKTNNIWSNLRDATHAENTHNRPVSKRNVLGVKGVSWRPDRGGRYAAQIYVQGKNKHLGLFNTIEEASAAYKAVAELHRGVFARS